MGYQIYYSDRDVIDLIGDINKVNNEISDMVNDYLYDATNKLKRIKDTIKIISKHQSDNEGWNEEFYSYERNNEDEIDKEYIDYLNTKYPEYESDEFYSESEVEKDLKKAYKFETQMIESIVNLKELIIKLEEL